MYPQDAGAIICKKKSYVIVQFFIEKTSMVFLDFSFAFTSCLMAQAM